MFEGSFVAIITPFAQEGGLDEPALRALVDWHVESGTRGLVPAGTTGENPTLTGAERHELWRIVIDQAAGRVPVIAGAGTNDTAETVALCREARALGADGVLVVAPYYNKPTAAGLRAHFTAAADAGAPVVMYNVPSRTGCGLDLETIDALSRHEGIVAIKEATADIAFGSEIHARCGDRLSLLSGDDFTALPLWAVGGRGAISVTANVAPALAAETWNAFARGDLDAARDLHERLLPLHRALFAETNPIPVKLAVSMLGRCRPEGRLPLTPASEGTRVRLAEVLAEVLDEDARSAPPP